MSRKVKYDLSLKLECIDLELKKHYSVFYVSKLKGPNESNIRKWLSFYEKYGQQGLLPRRNQSYSVSFKLKVLETIEQDFLSLKEACLEFNIPDSAIILKWQKDFTNFGVQGLKPKPKGRPKSMTNFKRKKRKLDKPLTREEELLLENEALRCELAYLKKLQALIQPKTQNKKHKS